MNPSLILRLNPQVASVIAPPLGMTPAGIAGVLEGALRERRRAPVDSPVGPQRPLLGSQSSAASLDVVTPKHAVIAKIEAAVG